MEKEGLVRAVQYIQDQGLDIGTMITDRHRQIAKWIRETLPDTTHLFDVWHVAKGKQLLLKLLQCKIILEGIIYKVQHINDLAKSASTCANIPQV